MPTFAQRFIVAAPEDTGPEADALYDAALQLTLDHDGTPLVKQQDPRMDTGLRSQPPAERDPHGVSALDEPVLRDPFRVAPRLDTKQGTRGSDDERGAAGFGETAERRSVGAEQILTSRI